jgi:hypothetical protein
MGKERIYPFLCQMAKVEPKETVRKRGMSTAPTVNFEVCTEAKMERKPLLGSLQGYPLGVSEAFPTVSLPRL